MLIKKSKIKIIRCFNSFNGYLWGGACPKSLKTPALWGIVKRKMRNKGPKIADELKATVKETWASIPPQQCHKPITSMSRRIEAVIKAKGAPTKY